MQGFDTKAIILFPKAEAWERKPLQFKFRCGTAVNKLKQYLETRYIVPYAFYTDDVARSFQNKFQFIIPLSAPDAMFAKNNCDGMSDIMEHSFDAYRDIIEKVNKKFLPATDMSVNDRFELLLKRDNAAKKEILKDFKIIIQFVSPQQNQYTVTPKEEDNRIIMKVNFATFIPTVYIGGREENPCDVLNVPYGNRSLENWGD